MEVKTVDTQDPIARAYTRGCEIVDKSLMMVVWVYLMQVWMWWFKTQRSQWTTVTDQSESAVRRHLVRRPVSLSRWAPVIVNCLMMPTK